MTEIRDDAVISEALSVIDKALADMLNRELVSTDEVSDLLLDVRSLLVTAPQPADHDATGGPTRVIDPGTRISSLWRGPCRRHSGDAGWPRPRAAARRRCPPCRPGQTGILDRSRVDVEPHVEAAVVRDQREVEGHAEQGTDRVVGQDLRPRDVAREVGGPDVGGGEVDRLRLRPGEAGDERGGQRGRHSRHGLQATVADASRAVVVASWMRAKRSAMSISPVGTSSRASEHGWSPTPWFGC